MLDPVINFSVQRSVQLSGALLLTFFNTFTAVNSYQIDYLVRVQDLIELRIFENFILIQLSFKMVDFFLK